MYVKHFRYTQKMVTVKTVEFISNLAKMGQFVSYLIKEERNALINYKMTFQIRRRLFNAHLLIAAITN